MAVRVLGLSWIDGYWTAIQQAAQLKISQLQALETESWWKVAEGNVALSAGVLGGVASGLASGWIAYRIFQSGLKAEHEKNLKAEETRKRELELAEEKHQAELAFSAAFKMSLWLQCGRTICYAVHEQIVNKAPDIPPEAPLAAIVMRIPDTIPEPERVLISEVSFLASREKAELIGGVFLVEAWGYGILSMARDFSKLRSEWDAWAPENVHEASKIDGDGRSNAQFAGGKGYAAQVKMHTMSGILAGILQEYEVHIGAYQEILDEYLDICRKTFPNFFPAIAFDWERR